MSPIIKTFLTLSAGVGLATGAVVVTKHSKALGLPPTKYSSTVSPIIIHEDGTVIFLGRVPPATIASDIRASVKNHDADSLNEQLVKHRFYVVPESMNPTGE